MPDIDVDLLLAHLEYVEWSVTRTLAIVERLSEEARERNVVSSFPSITATLQHVFEGELYYLIHMKGGAPRVGEVIGPSTYGALKQEWPALHAELQSWAKEHLAARKNELMNGQQAGRPIWMAVMQMANHTTHHLGQVVTLARQAGCRITADDWTDLIVFYQKRYLS